MLDKENAFEICIRDDPEDSTLGDVLFSVLPTRMKHDEIDAINFVRMLSQYQISSALMRGEKNISILDVYESPDREYLKRMGLNCPLRDFMGEDTDLLNVRYSEELDHLIHYSDLAYEFLFHRTLCGKYVSSVHNIIDVYQRINPKASKIWGEHRKAYIDAIAPAAFWIFKEDYLSARLFCRNANIDNLINLASENGFCVDDFDEMILPEPLRKKLLHWISNIPNIIDSDGFLTNTQQATDYQAMIISGLKTLSSLTIV